MHRHENGTLTMFDRAENVCVCVCVCMCVCKPAVSAIEILRSQAL